MTAQTGGEVDCLNCDHVIRTWSDNYPKCGHELSPFDDERGESADCEFMRSHNGACGFTAKLFTPHTAAGRDGDDNT